MYTSKVSEKGWIVIPKPLRQKYGLRKGSQLQIVDYGEVLTLVPLPDDPVEILQGLLKDGPSLTAELLAERTLARTQEEGRHAPNLGLG